jgi:Na+/H+-dicarboxylate symporter
LQLYYIHLLGIDYTPVQYAFLVVLAVVVSIGTVGAAAATTLVAATEGQLDKAVYNGEVEVPAAEAV